jgi:hypothetical protein
MKNRRKIENTVADSTLPKTPVQIEGRTYNLCCDFGALSQAESAINAEFMRNNSPSRVNLLVAMADENLGNTRVLFAAALRAFHPEIDFETGCALIHPGNVFEVAVALRQAWKAAMPEAKANPPVAQAAK